MLFNTFNPFNVLIVIRNQICLPTRLIEKILIDLYKEINITYYIVFKNVVRKRFNAKTIQDKEKLYNFCLKNGIIQEYGKLLISCIYEYDTFFLTNNLTLEYSYLDDCDYSLSSIINSFEGIAYKVNGIKINWFKRQIEKLKITFDL